MSTTQNNQTQASSSEQLAASFPRGFVWGAATAAYQIEGAAHEDGRGMSIWDTFAATPGKVRQGDTGDVAADHYHRFQADVDLMAELGLDAYRFSIAWPRIFPQGRGSINNSGLDFYERLVDALLARGIKPFATLYHWDLPQTLQDEGGWARRETAYIFADYVEIVAKRLGDRVASWITHNEPWVVSYLGHGIGVHAPGSKNVQTAVDVGHHLLLSHGLAVPRLRAHIAPTAQVGITLNLTPVYPADERPETARDVALADAFNVRWFVEPLFRASYPEQLFANLGVNPPPIQANDLATISTPIDFLGVNNYFRWVVRGQEQQPLAHAYETVAPIPGACYTETGWEVAPQGIRDLLVRLHHDYKVPSLYVTENGAAFKDEWHGEEVVSDPRRVAFLQDYIHAVGEAVQQGAPVHGYFVWSLMDNYEWAEGYSKRFGIVYIDYPTQKRILKESGRWYTDLLKAHHTRP
ncbi:MAG: GH1 family beta-glucosidase [Ktedonobacteraceae bacterium]